MARPGDFEATKKAATGFFAGSVGEALQQELLRRDKEKYSSFISEPWYDMYLTLREPLMINSNPQLLMNDTKEKDQAKRAANLVFSALRFYKTLKDEKLSPDVFHTDSKASSSDLFKTLVKWTPRQYATKVANWYKAMPLDMSQYGRLFSSTRVPKQGKDELVVFPENESRHIVVQHGSKFYTVDVVDEVRRGGCFWW